MPKVTNQDLERFASVGYPSALSSGAPVSNRRVESALLFESVLKVMAEPSSRLVSAAALALAELAARNDLPEREVDELADPVRRRLGYVSERLVEELNPSAATNLARYVKELSSAAPSTSGELTLGVDSASYLRMKKSSADEVNLRWQVYGEPEFRFLKRAS